MFPKVDFRGSPIKKPQESKKDPLQKSLMSTPPAHKPLKSNMSLLRKPPNPISAVYNSLKINRRFGDFLAEKSYRRGLIIQLPDRKSVV